MWPFEESRDPAGHKKNWSCVMGHGYFVKFKIEVLLLPQFQQLLPPGSRQVAREPGRGAFGLAATSATPATVLGLIEPKRPSDGGGGGGGGGGQR